MDRQQTKPIVLARIPNLGGTNHKKSRAKELASPGRMISQALSFKMLATAVSLLIVIAVVVGRSGRSADAPAAVEPLPVWEPSRLAVAGAATPVAEAPAPTPTPISPTPNVVSQPEIAHTPPPPATTDAPLMSTWPNPAYPTSLPEAGSEEPRTGVNQPMAIRPPEYIRNRYDSTRSGVR